MATAAPAALLLAEGVPPSPVTKLESLAVEEGYASPAAIAPDSPPKLSASAAAEEADAASSSGDGDDPVDFLLSRKAASPAPQLQPEELQASLRGDTARTMLEEERAAIVIQGRIRGAQDRRRAAATRLVMSRAAGDGSPTLSWLDVDVGDWLIAHDEPELVDAARSEFGVETLRDLLAVIQDPADATMFIPEDEAASTEAILARHDLVIRDMSDRFLVLSAVRQALDGAAGGGQ